MTELIKIGILYLVFIVTAIWTTGQYKKIFNFLTNSKKQYIEYMKDSSLGAGL